MTLLAVVELAVIDYHDLIDYSEDKDHHEWFESLSYSLKNIWIAEDDTDIFNTLKPVKVGDKVYPLICTYSTGNSYGTSIGHSEVIAIFTDRETAEKAREFLNAYICNNDYKKDVHILITNIEPALQITHPCTDYFDNIDDFYIKEIEVTSRE